MHTATEKKFFKNNVRNVTTLRTLRTIVNHMKKQRVIRWKYVHGLIENAPLFKIIERGKWGLSPFFIFVNRVFLGLHGIPLCYPNSSI